MATTTRPPTSPPEPRRRHGPAMGRERPLGGFELWTWLFMRISGLVLLVLAVGPYADHAPAGRRRGPHQLRLRRRPLAEPVLADVGLDAADRWRWSTASTACANITLDYVRQAGRALRDQRCRST